jgi:hypothetical protein
MTTGIWSLVFASLAAGLSGLLLNVFVLHWGTVATVVFAVVEVAGFGLLAHGRGHDSGR